MNKPAVRIALCLAALGLSAAQASEINSQLDKIVQQFAAAPQAAQGQAALAVFPFQAEDKLTRRKVDVAVGELLTIRLVQNGKFKLVERSQLETVLKEQKLGLSGAVESGTAAKVGQLVGARLVVLGNIGKIGKSYQITAKLVDAQSSEIVSAQVVEVPAQVFDEEAARYLVLVPDEQTIGLYVSAGYGSVGSVVNSSPQTFNGITGISLAGESAKAPEFGLGVRYFPARWLMLDVAYMPLYFTSGEMQYSSNCASCANAHTSDIQGTAIAFSANWVKPLAAWLKLFAGGGAGVYRLAMDDSTNQAHIISLKSGSNGVTNVNFTRPFVRAGAEWKPQARIGVGVFGNIFLTSSTLGIYAEDPRGTGQFPVSTTPLLTIPLPRFSTQATLSFYF